MNSIANSNSFPSKKQVPSLPCPSPSPSPVELFAVTIFGWCRSHPDASMNEFLDMLAQARARVEGRRYE